MKLRSICSIAALIAAVAFLPWSANSDIVTGSKSAEHAEVEGPEARFIGNESGSDVQYRFFAVPEPATFGIISLGLAIGGGLLVRNKRPAS